MLKTKKVEVPDVSYENENRELKIYRDQNPISPRKMHENLGIMQCSHKRYDLGDKSFNASKYKNWEEVEGAIIEGEDPEVILPLYLYDHSGLRIKVGSFQGQLPQGHARFDSGQVGFIYTTEEKLERFGLEDRDKEEIEEQLRREVREYDNYLRGEVYRFVLEENGEIVDSCGGFNGEFPEVIERITEEAGIDSLENWEEERNY